MGLLSRMTIPSALQDNEFLQAVFQPDLVSWILEMLSRNGLIANLYDSGEHELAIGKVKNSLKKGQVTPYRPRIILNALWDSVFDEQDYANEIAVIFSILNWEDTNK
jgi:hypothetical protein